MVKKLNIGGSGGTTYQPAHAAPQSIGASSLAMPVHQNTALVLKPFDMNEVTTLGGKATSSIPQATAKITSMVRSSDMDEIGKLLLDTVSMAKGYDPTSMEKKGWLSNLFAKAVNFKDKFDTVDKSVQQLIKQLDAKGGLFKQRITDLENIKQQLHADYEALELEIADILARCDWMDANPPQVDMTNPMEVGKLNEWKMVADIARRRADDLQRLRVLFEQQSAQIDQMKINSAALAMDMVDMKTTTIPALQSTFALYIINIEQKKGADFSKSMKSTTNDVLNKNAAMLGQNTTAITQAITTSNIELSTLQNTLSSITTSLSERERIMTEMKLRLRSEAPQLEQLSRDLSVALTK